MSLHKFAQEVASKGRGDDSLLIHMTPDEVQRLQQFAQANGRSLTINPETGLPEAGMLSDLFKMVAPIALGAFLGPAGLGMSSMMAGVATGGITTLATGSLSRGLMAGLGAYGGAGLAESFMNAGTSALGGAGAEAALQAPSVDSFVGNAEGMTSGDAFNNFLKSDANPAVAGKADVFGAGAKAAMSDPLGFAKNNLGNLAYASAPILAGAMVPTTTKAPTGSNENYIRQFDFNINPDTGKPDPLYGVRTMAPVKANEWKDKTFQGQRDLFRQQNPNPYNIGVASLNQPPQQQPALMNTGGIVALARGGVAHYEGGGGINEYDYAPGGGGDSNYSVREDGSVDYFANQFAPDVFAPVATAPVVDTPVVSAPVVDTPVVSAPVVSAPVVNTPVATAPVVSTPVTAPTGIETLTAATPTVTTPAQQTTGIQTLTPAATTAAATTTPAATTAATTTPAATTAATTTPYYFQVNPDVAAEYAKNNQGFTTPEAYAQAHYDKFGKKEGREFAPSAAASYAAANNQNLVTNTQKWIEEHPFATKQQIEDVIKASGMSQGDVQRSLDALVAKGELSAAERYWILNTNTGLAGLAKNNMQWLKEHPNATQAEIDKVIKAAGLDRDSALLPLTHGFQVEEDKNNTAAALSYLADPKNSDVQAWLKSDQGKAYLKDHPEFDAKDIAWTHYVRYGKDEGRKWGATPPVVPPVVPPFTSVVPGGTQLPGATVYDNGAYGNYGSGPVTGVDYLGNTVSIATPGDVISNTDGSRTVVPNIPGRPYGGFTGIEQLKSRYTAGGGSLGYTSKAPKTIEEFNQRFNKQTGDSLAAYNYLMGKGGGKYPVKSTAPKIAENYNEFVLGKKTAGLKPATVSGDSLTVGGVTYNLKDPTKQPPADSKGSWQWDVAGKRWAQIAADGTVISGGDGNTSGNTAGTTGIGNNSANSVSGLAQDANPNISVVSMDTMSPDAAAAAAATAADSAAASAASATGDAPGSDGSPGSGAKRGGLMPRGYAIGGGLGTLGSYSDGGRLLKGPGDGVSDSIPATIGRKQQPARLADGEFVIPARIVSELGNGSTDAGAKKLYAMMDRVQRARGKTTGKNKVAANSRSDKYLPA